MATSGTDAYTEGDGLPPLVRRALAAARAHGFPHSCRPEQGRLLHAPAGGARGRIAETGTGPGCTGWSIPRSGRPNCVSHPT